MLDAFETVSESGVLAIGEIATAGNYAGQLPPLSAAQLPGVLNLTTVVAAHFRISFY